MFEKLSNISSNVNGGTVEKMLDIEPTLIINYATAFFELSDTLHMAHKFPYDTYVPHARP